MFSEIQKISGTVNFSSIHNENHRGKMKWDREQQ